MPAFFLLSGFFAHLLLERRMTGSFVRNRIRQTSIPLIIFWPIMLFIIPPVGMYGWVAEFSYFPQGSEAAAIPLFHLWFLYYLLIQCAGLLCCRAIATRILFAHPFRKLTAQFTFTRLPVTVMAAAATLLIIHAGEDSYVLCRSPKPTLLYCSLTSLCVDTGYTAGSPC